MSLQTKSMPHIATAKNTTSRIIYLDVLRILATFGVIVLHVAAYRWTKVAPSTAAWHTFNVLDSAVRWAVPVFMMISGALFLNAEYTFKKLYGVKILRIITCFIFWSAIYAGWYYVGTRDVKDSLAHFLQGPEHFWFLFAIVGFYMLVPLMKKMVETEQLTKYFLLLSFAVTVLVYGGLSLLAVFAPSKAKFALSVFKKTNLNMVVGYGFYFVLGYFLHQKQWTKKQAALIYAGGICGLLITIIGTIAVSYYKNEASGVFYEYNMINVTMEAVAVFVFAQRFASRIKIKERTQSVLAHVASRTFGVFLVHWLILFILDHYFHLSTISFHVYLSVPLIIVIVTVVSYAVSEVLHAVPLLKKYIV